MELIFLQQFWPNKLIICNFNGSTVWLTVLILTRRVWVDKSVSEHKLFFTITVGDIKNAIDETVIVVWSFNNFYSPLTIYWFSKQLSTSFSFHHNNLNYAKQGYKMGASMVVIEFCFKMAER